jgi:hypothetical protein
MYCIAFSVAISDGKTIHTFDEMYIPDDGNRMLFQTSFEAKMFLRKILDGKSARFGEFGREIADLTKMRVVEVPDNAEFICFPDLVQVPLISTAQQTSDIFVNQFGKLENKIEYSIAEFEAKLIATGDLKYQLDELKKKGVKVNDLENEIRKILRI